MRTPRSESERMRRPKPCLRAMTALGTWRSKKGLTAGGFNGGHAGLDDGVCGDGEGEAVDDDAGELLALHVYALPEGAGGEEDGVGSGAELLQQNVPGGGALEEQGVGELLQHALVEGAHLGVAGEEAEGAALGDFKHAAHALGGVEEEVGLAGVRHAGGQVKQGLAAGS